MQTHIAMRRALTLARRGLGSTFPNPSVGCVILDARGVKIAEGATGAGGRPHAEEIALNSAGERAAGGHAVVTLEPCNRRSSGSPSCTDRLIAARIECVTIAVSDPHPNASGEGIRRLQAAGIRVLTGVASEDALALNAGFFSVVRTGLPLVHITLRRSGYDSVLSCEVEDCESALRALAERGMTRIAVPPTHPQAAAFRRFAAP